MRARALVMVGVGALLILASVTTFADNDWWRRIHLQLSGYAETPLAVSTPGEGRFVARINNNSQEIEWQLSYDNLSGPVTQAHIHFGSPSQTGGVILFLCTNLGNGPVGTQACPPTATADAPLTGVSTPADIIGPSAQGIAAGEFAEVVAAIRNGAAYVNVHSATFPVGEIRAQFPDSKQDRK